MARITYDRSTAAAFRAAREISRDGLAGWRDAIERHLAPAPGITVVDVGAGTGVFSAALHDWFEVAILAVEPSQAMRALIPRASGITILDGSAEDLPLDDACADGAWLSTVTHHITDLPAAAAELRRVLRPGAPVLIRDFFPGQTERIGLLRFFPETRRVLSTYPTAQETASAFATAGFAVQALEPVPQQTAPSLTAIAAKLDPRADTALRSLSGTEFAAGLARLHAAAALENGPVIDYLDLLVLR
jgi:ubiquinone/menaquinone biosynthesis C-methylase UbiE